MFTGIITELGKIKKISKINTGFEIEIESLVVIKTLKIGDSVAVNGCCLTVKEFTKNSFKADISFATLKNTTFSYLKAGDFVNLEDSVKLDDKFGGHFVSGHVDCIGEINQISKKGDFYNLAIKIPKELLAFTAPKGSISIEGISLTISEVHDLLLYFAIIPLTYENTNLKFKKVKDKINVEVDLIARYIANIVQYSGFSNNFNYISDINKEINRQTNININKEMDKKLEEKLKEYGFK